MANQNVVLFLLAMLVIGCNSNSEIAIEQKSDSEPPSALLDGNLDFRTLASEEPLTPGLWQYQNGIKTCQGYLTRFEDQDFCASEVPDDWVPFTFNDQTYYVQPLAGS